MRPRIICWASCLFTWLALALGWRAVHGQTPAPLEVRLNEAVPRFAEQIDFRLRVAAPTSVRDVVLRFRTDPRGPVNRRRPEFGGASTLEAHYREELVRGEIPAGATVTWWWTLTDGSGRSLETAPRSFVYLDERLDWQALERPGVRIWSYGQGTRRAGGIAEQVVTALDRLEQLVGSRPPHVIQIVGYVSAQDMQRALTPRGEVYESKLTTLGARIAGDIILLRIDGQRAMLREVLAHELSHLVLDAHFAEEYVDAPMWLDEGLAMYSEGPLERDEERMLQAALRTDSLLSIRSLTTFPGQAELVPLAYAQSRDVVAFMIEFHKFLTALGRGEATVDETLRQNYGLDQATLYDAYRASRGLAPAATPAPGTRPAWPGQAPTRPPLCGSTALVLPAGLLIWLRRRGSPPDSRAARLYS